MIEPEKNVRVQLLIRAVLVRVGRRRLVICKPDYRRFGHIALDVLYALEAARDESASLLLVRPPRVVAEGLFHMVADGVRVRTVPRSLAPLSMALWTITRRLPPPRSVRDGRLHARLRRWNRLRRRIDAFTGKHDWARRWRTPLRRGGKRLLRVDGAKKPANLYLRRRLIRVAQPARLAPPFERRCAAFFAQAGIGPDAAVVSIHARGWGFHPDTSVRMRHEIRNSDITTYFPAVDHLVARGYWVVRLGDPSMEPVTRPGVVDLAPLRPETPGLDIFALTRSEFLLGSQSEPAEVALLTGTPRVIVNATDVVENWPIRPTDILLLKHVYDEEEGRTLSLDELLRPELRDPMRGLKGSPRYHFVDNTSDEILAAVQEMLDLLHKGTPETDDQRAYRDRATAAAAALPRLRCGADEGYLGDGRIARVAFGSPVGRRTSPAARRGRARSGP